MFGRHATTFALPDHCAAPLRWQQPGASTSGRLGDRQTGLSMPGHRDTCTSSARPRRRSLRIQAATEEATSTSARQKVLDSVRESLARRAAGSGAGQRAGGKPAAGQAAARPRGQGGGKPGSGGKPSSIAQPFQGSAPVTLRRPPSGDATASGQRLSKVRRDAGLGSLHVWMFASRAARDFKHRRRQGVSLGLRSHCPDPRCGPHSWRAQTSRTRYAVMGMRRKCFSCGTKSPHSFIAARCWQPRA